MKIPFSPPFIDDDIKKEVIDTLESGWITTGPKVKMLEETLGTALGLEKVLCCNSATSAMMLCLHWYGVRSGDEVIIPSYTYAATALVVMHLGATPVMVDVLDDFNIDIKKIKGKITHKTKAIIPVDIAGWPCDYKELSEIANDPEVKKLFKAENDQQLKLGRILIMADAAHSLGASYRTKPTGKWADFTVFSFHAVKNVTTAEGGAICITLPPPFDNHALYSQLRLWTLNGQTRDALSKSAGTGWRYDIVYPGFKINMPDICAAIGLGQMRKYYKFILPERKRVFDSYVDHLRKYPWVELPPLDNHQKKSSYHLFALRIVGINEAARDRMIELISETGVSVNVHFQPLPILTLFKEKGYDISDFPAAFDNYSREISLPIYPGLDEHKIEFIVNAVVNSYRAVRPVEIKSATRP